MGAIQKKKTKKHKLEEQKLKQTLFFAFLENREPDAFQESSGCPYLAKFSNLEAL